jgi:hypothetical protein
MTIVRRVLGAGAIATVALVAAPPATAQTPEVTSVIGSADGLFVELFDASFGPEPSVTLPPEGGSVSEELADVDETVGGLELSAGLLRTSAEGEVGPDGFATAEATVSDLELDILEVASHENVAALQEEIGGPFFSAEAITATCEADLDGVSGSTSLVNVTAFGEDLSGEPEPNTPIGPIDVDGDVLRGTLNHQVENPDGSLSVTALVLEGVETPREPPPPIALNVDEGNHERNDEEGEVVFTLAVGPATCGVVEDVADDEVPDEPEPAVPVVVTPVFTG